MENDYSLPEWAMGPMARQRRASRARRFRIIKNIAIALLLIAAIYGSGIAESQRIKVMEQTSPEATMIANGLWQK